ncbi:hypothetical protein ACSMX9_02150 [Streptomyces sp. LE64]|uniref:hypothetical protein n=1 Tax=Streptomyces sp. LE64 TaxID=3448653 RepID=UPI0040427E3D
MTGESPGLEHEGDLLPDEFLGECPCGLGVRAVERGQAGGGPPAFDQEACRQRDAVVRCVSGLNQWRAIATRYEKAATIYLAGLHVAGIFLW